MQSVIICATYPIISDTPDVGILNNGSTFNEQISYPQRAAAFIITQAAAQRLRCFYVLGEKSDDFVSNVETCGYTHNQSDYGPPVGDYLSKVGRDISQGSSRQNE